MSKEKADFSVGAGSNHAHWFPKAMGLLPSSQFLVEYHEMDLIDADLTPI